MKFPVALQLYSVRDQLAADFEGTLKAVKEMGYDGVEFAGLYGHTPAEIKALCAKYDLVPISAHVPYIDMRDNPAILDDYREIGCEFVVVPYLIEEHRPGHEGFGEVLANLKTLIASAADRGMKMAYHNHDFEFVKVGEEYALEVIFRENPALQTELDTCWVRVGGEDPASFLRKYAGRSELLHLKDYVGSKTNNMYALIGIDDGKGGADSPFEFRPVGHGVQNFPAILAAAEECGTRWVIVEMDRPSMGKTPMECAEMGVTYIKSIMD